MEQSQPKNPFAQPKTNQTASKTEQETTQHPPIEERPFGPIIGIIIIVTVLAFGALYFWGTYSQNFNKQSESPNQYFDDTSYNTFLNEDNAFDTEVGTTYTEIPLSESDITPEYVDTTLDDISDLDTLEAEFQDLESQL